MLNPTRPEVDMGSPAKACANPACLNSATSSSRSGLCRECYGNFRKTHGKGSNGIPTAGQMKEVLAASRERFEVLNGEREDFWQIPNLFGNWLVASDIHVPLHDANSLTKLMQVGVRFNVKNLVIVGDLIDWAEISRFPKYTPNPDPIQPLKDAVDILLELSKVFHRIVVLKGNHERRLQRLLEQAVEGRTSAQRHLAALDLNDFTQETFRDQYVGVLEAWTNAVAGGRVANIEWYAGAMACIEGPAGMKPWRVIHQGNGSILPPNEAQRHWMKWQCPIITTHTHLFGLRIMPNGIDPTVQLGTLTREEWHMYASEEPGGYPAWVRNFGMILAGKLYLFPESPYLGTVLDLEVQPCPV